MSRATSTPPPTVKRGPPAPATPPYTRVDVEALPGLNGAAPHVTDAADPRSVRGSIIPLSVLCCIGQAVITSLAANLRVVLLTSTMIPVLTFAGLFAAVLVLNPLLALVHRAARARQRRLLRPLNRVELMFILSAMLVTSGISTFGMSEQLIPTIAAPYNPEWNRPQRRWDSDVNPHLNPHLYIRDPATIKLYRQGIKQRVDGRPLRIPRPDDDWVVYFRYHWQIFRAIPWAAWTPPLAWWLIFLAGCYGIFYSLTYIVLDLWSHREKLIFPLARLPESLLPDPALDMPPPEGPRPLLPRMLRRPGFWIGFGISFFVIAWNGSGTAGFHIGLGPIPLGMGPSQFDSLAEGTAFSAITRGAANSTSFLIIFTAIGIAFLLPLEVTFSVWFYYLFSRLFIIIEAKLGYVRNQADLASDWLWATNPLAAQGGGGILLFAAVTLFRGLKGYARRARGAPLREWARICLPIVGLGLSAAVVVAWLAWNRIPVFWALVVVAFICLMTLGLMRIVAEGGIYTFQSHANLFHLYRVLGLSRYFLPALMAPLLPIYSLLFMEYKTFLAPNLANAAELQRKVGGGRTRFHLNMVLSIIATVVASLACSLYLAHWRGAQNLHWWFYNTGPQRMMDYARDAAAIKPQADVPTACWYVVGALWVGLSMLLRRAIFWFPHPIGYIMLMNPLTAPIWFSFFLGWVCKRVVVRYGGKATYDRTRGFFIGLIVGELIAIAAGIAFSLLSGASVLGIDLNRYS